MNKRADKKNKCLLLVVVGFLLPTCQISRAIALGSDPYAGQPDIPASQPAEQRNGQAASENSQSAPQQSVGVTSSNGVVNGDSGVTQAGEAADPSVPQGFSKSTDASDGTAGTAVRQDQRTRGSQVIDQTASGTSKSGPIDKAVNGAREDKSGLVDKSAKGERKETTKPSDGYIRGY